MPYMPFYIGDWEQDMNACSLQTEAAWLKVIVKMFKDDKCGVYKTSTKRLQILWKCSPEMVEEIISELQGEDIGEIKRDTATGAITFFNRRMIREKEISKKRSEAVQTRYKTPTKPVQTPEDENETDSEAVIKDEPEKRKEPKPELKMPWNDKPFRDMWEQWKCYRQDEHGFRYKSVQSEQAALTQLANTANGMQEKAIEIIKQSMANGWKGFFDLKTNGDGKSRLSPEQRAALIADRSI